MAAVAIRAQDATLFDLGQEIGPAAEHCDYGYLAKLVSQVIELQDYRIVLSACLARVLRQIRTYVRSVAVETGQSAPRPFDPFVVARSALGKWWEDKILNAE